MRPCSPIHGPRGSTPAPHPIPDSHLRHTGPRPSLGGMPGFCASLLMACLACATAALHAGNANRLSFLDSDDPFYVSLESPPLLTPQWVGEPGVDAVVILGLDDLGGNAQKYETFLRPIIERLKQIDGRAPISLFCNSVDPTNAFVGRWLSEGLNLEVHTLRHPCPILGKSNFLAAVDTFVGGIDLVNHIPGNTPVAFRTPCCDSINSPSPRLFSEIFSRRTVDGKFLQADSSIMNIMTTEDPLAERLVLNTPEARQRFARYLPNTNFVTTIDNYPYPYVLNRVCWEFPCVIPSDWEAQKLHGTTNDLTADDWNRVLDLAVAKQGTFNLVFHPHGWMRNDQVVRFIDRAVAKHGTRIKFLNFREALDRIQRNLLAGEPLRAPDGSDNGVRLLDVNADGHLDVVIGNGRVQRTRIWLQNSRSWRETEFPTDARRIRWGVIEEHGRAAVFRADSELRGAWGFTNGRWTEHPEWLTGLEAGGKPVQLWADGRDRGARWRDIDGDGRCELIVGNESQNAVLGWNPQLRRWESRGFGLPPGTSIVTAEGFDAGLRFVDINRDGLEDVLFSDEDRYSLHLFIPKPVLGWGIGWTREVMAEPRTRDSTIPPITLKQAPRNNGMWVRHHTAWWQNETTAHLTNHVDSRTFDDLLRGYVPAPKSPEESLAAFEARPGFKIELVAAEPLVRDPVAFDWDARGRLWVVEMGDYPLGVDGKGKPGGEIRILEDTNHDGRYDRHTVFLDGIGFPNGVMPWRDGVLISAAPDILFAADRDGDGRADVREVLFTGFREGNQQHRVNGFDYGLDNWIYGANGDSGGDVRSLATGREVSIYGRDFRFRPQTGELEPVEGQTQFGRHRDDWGHWFGNNNGTWAWHYFIPDSYVARNPRLPLERNKRVLANYPDGTRLYCKARTMQRFNTVGADFHCSSANSVTPYRDTLFGPGFERSLFVSDPVYNVVHREQLEPGGVTFSSHRAADERDREFLASRDAWFRPTMLKTGPDGALYVCDMYRLVIEHPEWIPADVAARFDLRSGSDRGRIYRVYPEKAKLRPVPNLASMAPHTLAMALNSPNGWQRDTAQRLLVDGSKTNTIPELERLARRARLPQVRVQALATLDGLGHVSDKVLITALADVHPAVRQHAVRLAEPALRSGKASPKLITSLLDQVEDPHPHVRYQLAFTLGEWSDPKSAHALARLAMRGSDDPDQQAAIATSLRPHAASFLQALDSVVPKPLAMDWIRNQALEWTEPHRATASTRGAKPGPARSVARPLSPSAVRVQLVNDWVPQVRNTPGNPAHGRELFDQQCAACHRHGSLGRGAGPDLASLTDYSPERLVTAILDPNRAVDERYRTYLARSKSGDEWLGILVSQGPNSITIQTADGERHTALRADLQELKMVPSSLMPEGLESVLKPADIADLIAFLGSGPAKD